MGRSLLPAFIATLCWLLPNPSSAVILPHQFNTGIAPLFETHNVTRLGGLKVENLAVRSNGQILVTIAFPVARLYQVDPLQIRSPILVTALPSVGGAFGIVELEPDIFYVGAGNFTLTNLTAVPNSFHVFSVDMRPFVALPNGSVAHPATIRSAASLPNVILANGMATLPSQGPNRSSVLIADTLAFLVWHVDFLTGAVTVAISDPTMKGPAPTGPGSAGINGIKIFDGLLYYTNTGAQAMYRIPIFESNGTAKGRAELVASNLPCDDFVLNERGVAYVAGPANAIIKIDTTQAASRLGQFDRVVAGTFNSTMSALVSPTAVQWGRGDSDRTSLYVTTNGGAGSGGNGTEGLSRIDVGDLAQLL